MDFFIKNKKTGEYWSEKYGWLGPNRDQSSKTWTKYGEDVKSGIFVLPRNGEWEQIVAPAYFYYFRQSADSVKFIRYHRGRGVACNVIIQADDLRSAYKKAAELGLPGDDCPYPADHIDYNRWNYNGKATRLVLTMRSIGEEAFVAVPEKPNSRNQGYVHFKDGTFKFFQV